MSVGSDEAAPAPAPAPEGVCLLAKNYSRAYGKFARVLGHYGRETHDATSPDAIRRVTSCPAADNLSLADCGGLKVGAYADLMVRGRAWTGAPGGGCRARAADWRWSS